MMKYTKNDAIAKQAIKSMELKRQLRMHRCNEKKIFNEIFCIGGPLNDNREKYTHEQLAIFARIARLVE